MADVLTNLSMNQQDDMEITSEAGQGDVDFDIDFEPTADFSGFQNEDEMQDDTPITYEQEDIELRSATDNNDYMIDDVSFERVPDQQDGLMLDDAAESTVDEELLDLSEDDTPPKPETLGNDLGNNVHAYSTTEERLDDWSGDGVVQQPEITITNVAQAEPEVYPVVAASPQNSTTGIIEAHDAMEQPHDRPENTTAREAQQTLEHDGSLTNLHGGEESVSENPSISVSGETHPAPVDEVQTTKQAIAHDAEGHDSNNPDDIHDHNIPSGVQVATPHSEYSEDHPTFTGLHPTVVKYDGGQYTLFPSSEPSEGEEYFLADENLVNSSIGDLLQACRAVLGEAITEDFELELQVDDLELSIGEDSKAAFSASWSELLDLFVQLHHNDGTDHPPPMIVSLITRPRFANRLTLLSNIAAEGKGLSQVPGVYGLHEVDADGAYAHDATEYIDAAEIQDDLEKTDLSTNAQQTGNDLNRSVGGTNGNSSTDGEGATERANISHSIGAPTELDFPDPLADESSHTVSRDEAEEIYLQDDDSQTDQLYNLAGEAHNDETDESALQYDGIEDELGDDDQPEPEEVQTSADDTASTGPGYVTAASELETSVERVSNTHSQGQAGVVTTGRDAGKESPEASAEVQDTVNPSTQSASQHEGQHESTEANTAADEDEIDFEDELDNAMAEDGSALKVVDAGRSTSRATTKRSMDEVDDEEDSEAKRHRPL
ncbi:hypothetical protein K461DRAFT_324722 [Myriangium duriaei CBS 260.36]|uniref:Uncharacterized protein n=1 Tax=Myriangium duriaei CBS 260.36 TaxID=1168546 RepID=A0A9P4IU17_9PEZI|nr:hypothetical protein K461DRAFT_324722 [Myriangium duriaei CBS 260.36]